MSTKFVKKGSLLVDFDNAKLHKAGDEDSKTKKFMKKANLEVAKDDKEPSEKAVKSKAVKAEKAPAKKAEKVVAKAPAKKAVKEEKGEKAADTRKLKLLVKENPKREGSSSFDRYELYRSCKTVADFITAGGTAADVRYDAAKGYIQVD